MTIKRYNALEPLEKFEFVDEQPFGSEGVLLATVGGFVDSEGEHWVDTNHEGYTEWDLRLQVRILSGEREAELTLQKNLRKANRMLETSKKNILWVLGCVEEEFFVHAAFGEILLSIERAYGVLEKRRSMAKTTAATQVRKNGL